MKRILSLLPRLIGPTILIWTLVQSDVLEIFKYLSQVSITPLLLGYFLFLPTLVIRAARWKILLLHQKIQIRTWELFTAYSFSCFVGFVTPGRIGEFIKLLFLKKKGFSLPNAFVSVLVDRLLDVILLLTVGSIAFSTFLVQTSRSSFIGLILILSVCMLLLAFWALTHGKGLEITLKVLRHFPVKRLRGAVSDGYQEFTDEFKKIQLFPLITAFIFTIVAWALNYLSIYFFSLALGFSIPYFEMSGIASIFTLVVLIPVSIMGLGTRDSSLVMLLSQYGITQAEAVAFSTICLSFSLAAVLICSFSLFSKASKIECKSNRTVVEI